jgi:hypothetical protein
MTGRKLNKFDYVSIIGGPHAGERGHIREVFSDHQYGVKVLTGPEKDQRGTFVAKAKDLQFDDGPSSLPNAPSPNHVWDQATGSWQELGEGAGVFIDVEEVEDLIDRLFIRARIRRAIPNRKSVQEHKADRLAMLLEEAGFTITELLKLVRPIADGGFKEIIEALKPFAGCVYSEEHGQQINPEEDDEEWAKFRLLVKDYRRAFALFQKLTGPTTQDAEPQPAQQGSEQP